MPPRAWGTLLRYAVQGLHPPPPKPPKPSADGSRQPTPGHGPLAPHRPGHHPTTRAPGRERAKGRPAAREREKAPGDGHVPTRTGHCGEHNTGAGNHGRATNTGSRTGQGPHQYGRGRTRGWAEEGHTAPEGPRPPHPPHPVDTARPPGDTGTGGGTPGHTTDHLRGTRPPRRATAAKNGRRANHTRSRPRKRPPRTCHCTLTARRRRRRLSTAKATTRTQGHGHRRERGRGRSTNNGGGHGGKETSREGNEQSRGGYATPPYGPRYTPRDRDPQRARDQGRATPRTPT